MQNYYFISLFALMFSCVNNDLETFSNEDENFLTDSSQTLFKDTLISNPDFDFENCPKAWDLEEAMAAPDSFCSIALLPNDGREKLTEVPEELKQMPYLRSLYIDRNRITHIPSFLSNLEELWMGQSALKECPTGIENLEKLKVLDLAYNQISELDPAIFTMKNLEVLALFDNALSELPPEIGELNQLKKLALSGNSLEKLPLEITQLNNLEELYLNDMGLGDDAFPLGMEGLKSLKKLSIGSDMSGGGDGNSFSEIPEWIYELDSLEELTLSWGQITSISSEIGELKNLRVLIVEGNMISSLPKAIYELPKLEYLAIGDNEFEEEQLEEIKLNLREDVELSIEVEVGC